VNRVEQSVLDLLGEYSIVGARREAMPGVYVNNAKIAAIGLRAANHATYHGLALNVDMELAPFQRINPCGYADLAVTQLREFGVTDKMAGVAEKCVTHLKRNLDD
jgi:lipoyl(octanoyl) transferase